VKKARPFFHAKDRAGVALAVDAKSGTIMEKVPDWKHIFYLDVHKGVNEEI